MNPATDSGVNVSCRSKVRYATRAQAKRSLKEMRRRPGGRHLQIYECKHCPNFHIGNPPGHQTYMRPGAPYTTGRTRTA